MSQRTKELGQKRSSGGGLDCLIAGKWYLHHISMSCRKGEQEGGRHPTGYLNNASSREVAISASPVPQVCPHNPNSDVKFLSEYEFITCSVDYGLA